MPADTSRAAELCGALFDTNDGTAICEVFGAHVHHSGVLEVGVFRCHRCRRRLTAASSDVFGADVCRCSEPSR